MRPFVAFQGHYDYVGAVGRVSAPAPPCLAPKFGSDRPREKGDAPTERDER
jgi:hypothetical protein